MGNANSDWPVWLKKTTNPAYKWVRELFLEPLYEKVHEKSPSLEPALLLSNTDKILITALRHYKSGGGWSHELARVDIRLEIPEIQSDSQDVSIIFDRTISHDLERPKDEGVRRAGLFFGTKHPALDRIKFYYPSDADAYLLGQDRLSELSYTSVEVSGQYFNLLYLGFILETHSARHPEYHLYSHMCYWYAGSTLDSLRIAFREARQEAESYVTGGEARDDSDKRGRAVFLEKWGWELRRYESKVADEFETTILAESGTERLPTSELIDMVKEAEKKSKTFRVNLLLDGKDLIPDYPVTEDRKECLRRHLITTVPIEIGKKGSTYRLTPKPSPGFLLMDSLAMEDSNDAETIVDKARKLFYAENRFVVALKALAAFLDGKYQRYEMGDLVRSSIQHITVGISTEEDPTSYQSLDRLLTLPSGVKVRIVLVGFGDSQEGKDRISTVSEAIASTASRLFCHFEDFKMHKLLMPHDIDNSEIMALFDSLL